MDDKQQTGLDLDRGCFGKHFVADTAGLIRVQGFVPKRPFQSLCLDAVDRAAPRDQRNNIAAPALDLNLVAAKEQLLHPVIETNVVRGVPRVCEQADVGEGLVCAPTQRGDKDELRSVQFNGASHGEFEVSLVFVAREQLNFNPNVLQLLKVVFIGRIQITHDQIRCEPQSQGMPRAAICADNEIVLQKEGPGSIGVRQVTVGEDNNTLQNKTILRGEGWLMHKLYSLRQHDLDQVIRVERGSLLSVPQRGTPRSIVILFIRLVGYFVNLKIQA